MSKVASYHPLGARPHYYRTDGTAHAPRIRDLIQTQAAPAWDLEGVRQYLKRAPDGCRTCFAGIRVVGPRESLWNEDEVVSVRTDLVRTHSTAALLPLMEQAMQQIVADGSRTAVALSGGLDSALVVSLLHSMGRKDVPVVTLATHLPGYCELEATQRTARLLGVTNLEVIEVDGEALIEALPAAILAAEVPLFNLHPVSRWVLAQALRKQGVEVLISGDGADPVFAGSDPRNYLPIVGALTRESGLELRSPFFDEALAAAAPAPTRDKAALRDFATGLLPAELLARPKTACYAPTLDVSRYWRADPIRDLARALNVDPPAPGSDGDGMLWTTLGILSRFLT